MFWNCLVVNCQNVLSSSVVYADNSCITACQTVVPSLALSFQSTHARSLTHITIDKVYLWYNHAIHLSARNCPISRYGGRTEFVKIGICQNPVFATFWRNWKLSESEFVRIGNCHNRNYDQFQIGNCQNWNWSEFRLWQFPILTNSNSDKFQSPGTAAEELATRNDEMKWNWMITVNANVNVCWIQRLNLIICWNADIFSRTADLSRVLFINLPAHYLILLFITTSSENTYPLTYLLRECGN